MTATVQAVSISVWRATAGLAGWIVVSFSAAALGAFFTPGEWYAQLRKPSWNPPNWIFGPVWSALYTMMGISAWLVWLRGGFSRQGGALSLFLVHLLFNAAWSPLFFGLKKPGVAFVDISFLWVTLAATTIVFWRIRRTAALLLLPYLGWVSFAACLNFTIWMLNR